MKKRIDFTRTPYNFNQTMTQEDFADLIGVTQPTVSGWIRDGRLRRGDTALVWLRAHVAWLQAQAAKRGEEPTLTAARTALVREQADAQAMKNDKMRREWAPVGVLDAVLGAVGRQVQAELATLVPAIERECPALPPDVRRIVVAQVEKAVARADGLSVAAAPAADPDDDDGA